MQKVKNKDYQKKWFHRIHKDPPTVCREPGAPLSGKQNYVPVFFIWHIATEIILTGKICNNNRHYCWCRNSENRMNDACRNGEREK